MHDAHQSHGLLIQGTAHLGPMLYDLSVAHVGTCWTGLEIQTISGLEPMTLHIQLPIWPLITEVPLCKLSIASEASLPQDQLKLGPLHTLSSGEGTFPCAQPFVRCHTATRVHFLEPLDTWGAPQHQHSENQREIIHLTNDINTMTLNGACLRVATFHLFIRMFL